MRLSLSLFLRFVFVFQNEILIIQAKSFCFNKKFIRKKGKAIASCATISSKTHFQNFVLKVEKILIDSLDSIPESSP